MQVGDVQQEEAAGGLRQRGQELGLVHRRLGPGQRGGDVLQRQGDRQPRLGRAYVVDEDGQRVRGPCRRNQVARLHDVGVQRIRPGGSLTAADERDVLTDQRRPERDREVTEAVDPRRIWMLRTRQAEGHSVRYDRESGVACGDQGRREVGRRDVLGDDLAESHAGPGLREDLVGDGRAPARTHTETGDG